MVVAILLALKDVVYPAGNSGPLPSFVPGRSIHDIICNLMALGKSYPAPPWGRSRFCTRCDRENHFYTDCYVTLSCDICQKSGIVCLYNGCKTHATSKCMFNYIPLPVKNFGVDKSSPQLTQAHLPGHADDDRMEDQLDRSLK
jgi:hypothetical protein